jgi:hypothetical protein
VGLCELWVEADEGDCGGWRCQKIRGVSGVVE